MAQGRNPCWRSSIPVALIFLLILTAFGLRLLYLTRISLYIDEFTSIWAGRLILQRGLPLTPAGVVYHRGILFSYVVALSSRLFGASAEASRVASVFIATVTIPCLFLVGRRMFSDRTGLFAAAFLSFAPQAIAWGGRARMYALLQLLSLLAAYFLFAGTVESQRRTHLYLFLVCFWCAVFTQEQAILLYPALLLAVVALGRWRWLFRRRGILINALCCLSILSRYLLDQVGRPTQLELVQATSASSGLARELTTALTAYLSFFLHPDQLLLTILCGVGVVLMLRALAERGALAPERRSWFESLGFLYLVLVSAVVEMLVVGGARWSDPRYLFMILPLLILGASSSLDRVLALVSERLPTLSWADFSSEMVGSSAWPVMCSVVGVIAVAYLPAVKSILCTQIEGYDRAMEYVGEHWHDGDLILMASPPVCAVYLDHCDYYAIQKGYEGYVIDRRGQTVDVWTGAPLLNSVEELKEVLRNNDRVWFVVDGWRLATRYEVDFLQTVAEHMDTVEEVQGVKILRSHDCAPPRTPTVSRRLLVNLQDQVALVRYDLERDCVRPEDEVCVTLYWRPLAPLDHAYTVFVHLVSRSGSIVGQHDGVPIAGLYPTVYWEEGQEVPDRHCLVPDGDLPEDRYLLEVGMYVPETAQRLEVIGGEGTPIDNRAVLDYLWIGSCEESMSRPAHAVGANLADQALLLGYDLGVESSASGGAIPTLEPGALVPVALHWEALAPMERDFTVFVHLVDRGGQIWGQSDSQPDRGFYPTSFWDLGERIRDEHDISIDASTPAGQYRLVAGMYLSSTGERLPVVGDDGQIVGDQVLLTTLHVEKA